MGRRRKIPGKVVVRIPSDKLELYETPILEILLPEEQRKEAEKIIRWIKENGRIYPEELKELWSTAKEQRAQTRALNRLIALGLIGRGKEGSYIFSRELENKLMIMIEKLEALRRVEK